MEAGADTSSPSRWTRTSYGPAQGGGAHPGLRKEIEQLEVLLPICSYCKRIRNDHEEWEPLEKYIEEHFEQLLSHGICPDCYTKYVSSARSGTSS